jgi:nitroimidazol reductase NimA-like FMN-containing flavoprotein (pyridoxamine 5'-phosphate oxidase superfamily)
MTAPHPTPSHPARGVDELTYQQSMQLLATQDIGRLAVMVEHYPQVFPVNYRLDGDIVVFRTHVGTKLLAAHHNNVAFEVDHLDPATRSGWSVLIQGMAEDIEGKRPGPVTERSHQLDIQPWAPGDKPRLVRIIPAKTTGRRISSDPKTSAARSLSASADT